MHVTGGNGRQTFPSPGAQVIEFWLRTRGVQSLGNLEISRWLLIGVSQAQGGLVRSSEDNLARPTELFTCTVGRGILPIIFERLKILFRPLYPSLRPGEGVKDRLTGQSVEPSPIIGEAKIFLYG